MTPTLAFIASVITFLAGVGLVVTGVIINNNTLLGIGAGLIGTGVGGAVIPRAQDI